MRFRLLWKWRWKRKNPAPSHENSCANGLAIPIVSNGKSCAKRAVSTFAGMVPETPEVEAFVRWMRQHNCTGKWRQDDLYEVYFNACQLAEFECLGPIRFGKGLAQVGCRRWREDLRKGGKGERIWMVSIPVAGDLASKPRDLASENRLPKPPKSIGKLGENPLVRKPVRRVAYQ